MEKIKREIKRFIKSVDKNVDVVFHDGHMESDSLNSTIYINIDEYLYEHDDEQDHLNVLKQNNMLIDVLLPTFIILHEVGHVVSSRKYKTKRMFDQYEKQVDSLVKQYKGLELLKKYKSLKVEKDADEYAYNYYLHNYEKVKAFDNKIKSIIF
jgi:hypothetical protein